MNDWPGPESRLIGSVWVARDDADVPEDYRRVRVVGIFELSPELSPELVYTSADNFAETEQADVDWFGDHYAPEVTKGSVLAGLEDRLRAMGVGG